MPGGEPICLLNLAPVYLITTTGISISGCKEEKSVKADNEQLNALVQALHDLVEPQIFKPLPLGRDNTALLLIDIQDMLRADNYRGLISALGGDPARYEDLLSLLDSHLDATLANIAAILKKCRETGIPPIHIKIETLLPDGRDNGSLHAGAGVQLLPGSPGAAIMPQAAPAAGEIVLTKTCSGIHVGTNIDRILRNLGIRHVIVCGFHTDQCISSSVRDLADLGYQVVLPGDAVCALSPQRHENALQSLRVYALVESTDSLLKRL